MTNVNDIAVSRDDASALVRLLGVAIQAGFLSEDEDEQACNLQDFFADKLAERVIR